MRRASIQLACLSQYRWCAACSASTRRRDPGPVVTGCAILAICWWEGGEGGVQGWAQRRAGMEWGSLSAARARPAHASCRSGEQPVTATATAAATAQLAHLDVHLGQGERILEEAAHVVAALRPHDDAERREDGGAPGGHLPVALQLVALLRGVERGGGEEEEGNGQGQLARRRGACAEGSSEARATAQAAQAKRSAASATTRACSWRTGPS